MTKTETSERTISYDLYRRWYDHFGDIVDHEEIASRKKTVVESCGIGWYAKNTIDNTVTDVYKKDHAPERLCCGHETRKVLLPHLAQAGGRDANKFIRKCALTSIY